MISIPDFVQQLPEFKAGISPEALKAKSGVEHVAVLNSNENTLGASPKAMRASKEASDHIQWYPDGACRAVRKRIGQHVGVDGDRVVVGNGSEGVMSYIFQGLFNRGDELLTVDGTFVAVFIWAAANNVKLQTVPLRDDYEFDLDRLLDAVKERTRAIYLANPNNPTGCMIPEADLKAFVEQVPDRCLVIVDEAYHEFAADLSPSYPDSTTFEHENVLTLRTFSKAYGMAGMRFGYGIGSPRLITALNKMKLTFEPSVVAQEAGRAALDDPSFLEKTQQNNRAGLSYWYKRLDEAGIDYVRSFGNFVMLDLGTEAEVQRVFEKLLEHGVMTRPLKAYGIPRALRITVGTPEENRMAAEALKNAI